MSTSIVFIGTSKYINFFPDYYSAIKENFLLEGDINFHVFTDQIDFCDWPKDVSVKKIEHKNWPFVTLLRYHIINRHIEEISKSENCVFIDSDLLWQKKVTEVDLFGGKKYFGVQHPGFVFNPKSATFERDIRSTAHVKERDDLSTYWQGCLWGAKSKEFVNMIDTLERQVQIDMNNNIVALWHDESHLNRFFIDIKSNVNTLHPGYATPEKYDNIKAKFPTVALHLHKEMKEFPRFEGNK